MALHQLSFKLPITENNIESLLLENTKSLNEYIVSNHLDTSKMGIYLSTSSAGINECIQFWKEAIIKTPSFVNPANFPWTLPNAPAAYIAYLLGITGPVYTFLSNDKSSNEQFLSAYIDFKNEMIEHALIVNLETRNNSLDFKCNLENKMMVTEKLQTILKVTI